ncbi:Mu transposase C-terminal domain-containing protein [Methylobacter sp. S3L5C]|uniref:Mu transposase C-terminal domain-containing protein n=1 Tax=Methylobacter sp. S3L5C TaxID=2839024 RepID=UPI001FAB9FF0|nr:Mu transposase C-terminal domain-containing protein [Methylobacter sp. S3L5C]UOA07814.1 Mu transposase C-terminal domain-containing protein [Methylobacter sp. S3L5C]
MPTINDINKSSTLGEISDATGIKKRTIERKAKKEGWKFTIGKNKQQYYELKDIKDEDIRTKIAIKRLGNIDQVDNESQDNNNARRTKTTVSGSANACRRSGDEQHEMLVNSKSTIDTNEGCAERGINSDIGSRNNVRPEQDGLPGIYKQQDWTVNDTGGAIAPVLAGIPARYDSSHHQSGLPPLNKAQLKINSAIQNLVKFVKGSGLSKQKALIYLNTGHADGTLPRALQWAIDNAWEKKRSSSVLSLNTYDKWLANFKSRGHYAPLKREEDFSYKPWHALAMALCQRPQGSVKRWIQEQLVVQFGEEAPEYSVLCSWFRQKASQIDLLKGRYSGSQLKSKKFYQHRTSEGLDPASLVHADGWNTHFNAPHPKTGEFVTYEVWHFHDVATRYVPEPGIGLTENAAVIAKALEHCVRELGVPARVQTDSTKVVKGSAKFTKALHSLEERLGFTWSHPAEVGNSQANGISENFNTSYLDKCSKLLATYQNKENMDKLTFKRVRKLTGQMVKARNKGNVVEYEQKKREAERMGKGLVFDSYNQARDWIIQICYEYNDRPHSALKMVTDEKTGKRQHQTPREALNEFIRDGWEPVALDKQELIEAFMPHVVVKVTRETVTPHNGMRYRNPDILSHWTGKEVIVAYDIDDYSRVWVKDMKGAPICEATFVESTRYHAMTAQEADNEKRLKQKLRRLEIKAETAIAQSPGQLIDGTVIDGEVAGLVRIDPIVMAREEPLKLFIVDEDFNEQEGRQDELKDPRLFLYGNSEKDNE